MIKRGLYLQGGGAKGAYQAGVLKAFHEKDIEFNYIAGTSIGSVNSYFWATGNMDLLEEKWNDSRVFENENIETDIFYNNEHVIDMLSTLEVKEIKLDGWFVNYAKVENNKIKNLYKNLVDEDKSIRLETICYSSKLPIRDENKNYDISLYEGMFIDGGLINNEFIEVLLDEKLDELIVIAFDRNFTNNYYAKLNKNIKIIYPNFKFEPSDTIRFEPEIIKEWFKIGYEQGMEYKEATSDIL